MLRQSGVLAQRLLCGGMLQTGNQGANRLLCNAMMLSTNTAAGSSSAGVEAEAALKPMVPQLSAAAAAALAAKRSIVGLGATSGITASSRPFSTSVLRSAAAAAPAPEAAAAAAGGQQAAGDRFSALRKFAKAAAAAAVAALGLMAATPALADSPEPYQWLFQDSATSTAQAMFDLHHDIMFFVISIITVVLYMLFQFATKFHYSRVIKPEKLTHHTTAEVIWTIIPTVIVLFIGIPSLTLIYSLDQHTERPGLTVKVVGRQWYWSYEMHDHLAHKLLDPDRLVAIAEKTALKA